MGERVIVEGSVQHNPLNEGSILWITESRMPLGIVDELFGPVKNPYYLVRYNSEEEVLAGIGAGTNVSFVAEFTS
jgi:H/ACA ribonucleoprotein complex non-core subunit NAF1